MKKQTNPPRDSSFSQLEKGDCFTKGEYQGIVAVALKDMPPAIEKITGSPKIITYLQSGDPGSEGPTHWKGYFHLVDETEWERDLRKSYIPYSKNPSRAKDLLGMAWLVNAFAPGRIV